MTEQDTTPTPTPPPKESPFPKPEPAAPGPGITALLEVQANSSQPQVPVLPRATESTPKTIRMVRPTLPGPAGQTPRPGSNPMQSGPTQPSAQQMQAVKSKTSRISLESAISSAQTDISNPESVAQAGVEGAPKTIRLKRPSEMPTLKVPVVQPGTHVPVPTPRFTPSASGTPPSRKTSRLPDPEIPLASTTASSVPLTQKRTIRVKRPGMDSASALTAGEPADDVVLTPLQPELAQRPLADTCNPAFIVAAAASIIVTGILIYLFYQQMYGAEALIY